MEIIVHIGTHKTGTSSLQNFFAGNIPALLKHGVHYPLGSYSGRNVNFLASRLVSGRDREVYSFIEKAKKRAGRKGAEKILISAE